MPTGGSDNTGDGLASQPHRYRMPGQPLLNRCHTHVGIAYPPFRVQFQFLILSNQRKGCTRQPNETSTFGPDCMRFERFLPQIELNWLVGTRLCPEPSSRVVLLPAMWSHSSTHPFSRVTHRACTMRAPCRAKPSNAKPNTTISHTTQCAMHAPRLQHPTLTRCAARALQSEQCNLVPEPFAACPEFSCTCSISSPVGAGITTVSCSRWQQHSNHSHRHGCQGFGSCTKLYPLCVLLGGGGGRGESGRPVRHNSGRAMVG